MQTHQDKHEIEIRTRAHAIWEDEGQPDGRHLVHWQRALMEVIAIKQNTQKQALAASSDHVTPELKHLNVDLIDGIGPKISAQLADVGIATLHQIAVLTNEEMADIDEALDLRGRSEREEWISQAHNIIAGKAPHAEVDQDTLANT